MGRLARSRHVLLLVAALLCARGVRRNEEGVGEASDRGGFFSSSWRTTWRSWFTKVRPFSLLELADHFGIGGGGGVGGHANASVSAPSPSSSSFLQLGAALVEDMSSPEERALKALQDLAARRGFATSGSGGPGKECYVSDEGALGCHVGCGCGFVEACYRKAIVVPHSDDEVDVGVCALRVVVMFVASTVFFVAALACTVVWRMCLMMSEEASAVNQSKPAVRRQPQAARPGSIAKAAAPLVAVPR